MLRSGSKNKLVRRCAGRGHAHIRALGLHKRWRQRLGAQVALATDADEQVPVVLILVMVAPLLIMMQAALRRSRAYKKLLFGVVLASVRTDPAACYQRQHAQEQHTQC